MEPHRLEIRTRIQVARTPHEVFEAIADPGRMSGYFIRSGSGRLETGNEVRWQFPEFDEQVPVRAAQIRADEYLSFRWDNGDRETLVEILLSPAGEQTVVTVTEKDMPDDEAGIRWLKGNTEGWANFLACLKAYLEFGINLRAGAFDFMKAEK